MAIIQNINHVCHFREAFRLAGREDQFSYEGLEVLFNYLEQLSDDTGEPIELDVIALCCEYDESTIEGLIDSYNLDVSYAEGDKDGINEIVEVYLNYHTSICGRVNDGFVYAAF